MSTYTLLQFWNDFWFKRTSVAPLALLRIVLGILLFTSTLLWIPDCALYFGPNSFVAEKSVDIYQGLGFSVFYLLPRSDELVRAVILTLLFSAVCLTVGLFSRTSALIAFLCLTSLHHRNPFVLNSGDVLLRLFMFILIFAPAGRMWSVDAASDKKRGRVVETECAPWTMRLIQIQIFALYCQAFWCKASGIDWASGVAVYYCTHLPEYFHLPVPAFLTENEFCVKALTWGTLVIEFSLWGLIWIKEFRYWVLLAGLAMHFGIDWSMNIPLFEWITVAGYIAFVEPKDVVRFVEAARAVYTNAVLAIRIRLERSNSLSSRET
jgi:hypothetical protein